MPAGMVVIGASMGGLGALEVILGGLVRGFSAPIALVVHRGIEPDGLLPFLQERCGLPVLEPDDKTPLRGGCVYVAPADYHLLIDDGRFALSTEAKVNWARPSIDVLFESAALIYRKEAVAIALTGASNDGAEGARRVQARGGEVIVQDPATADSPVLPRAVLASVPRARVMKLPEITTFLNERAASR